MIRSRKLAIVVAIAVLVLAGVPLTLRLLVSPNQFKPLLARAVHGALGLDLAIEGDLSLSFFPRLAITAGKTTLKNPPGFPGDLASFRSLRLEASLGKLLEKRLDVNTLVLASPVVALVRTRDGKANWEALRPLSPAPGGQPAPADASGLEALTVQALTVTDATVTYDDQQSGQSLKITDATLATGPVRFGEPVRLRGGLDFADDDPAVHGRVDYAADLNFTPQGPRLALDGVAVKSRIFQASLPAGGLELTLTGRGEYDLAASRATWDFNLGEGAGAILAGNATLSLTPAGPMGEADFTLTGINPRALAAALGSPLPASRDPAALSRLEGQLHVSRTPDKTELRSPRLLLDKTTVTLDIALSGTGPFELAGRLGADSLDLDAYAPPGPETAKPAPAAPPAAPAALAALPHTRLDVAVGRLTAAGLALKDLAVSAEAKDGALRIAPLTASLYEGNIRAEARAEIKNAAPALSLRIEAAQLALEPLSRDATGQARLSGTAGFSADLAAAGLTAKELLASLGGSAKFTLRQGAVFGVSITPQSLQSLDALLGAARPAQSQGQTRYDSVSASFRLDHGQARTTDIAVSAPQLSATGAGTINLPQRTLDLKIVAHPLNLAAVPVKVSGSIDNPDVSLDAAAALAGVILAPVDAAGAAAKIPEKAAKDALDALSGLGGLLAPKKK
jgi:AsmA protein